MTQRIQLVIRDPERLAWGTPRAGLMCGLAAERDSASQGDQLPLHVGLQFDPASAAPELGMLNDFAREIGFTFTNTKTGASFTRDPVHFVGVGSPMASPESFVPLRQRPLLLHAIDVPLLTIKGEQLAAGSYDAVAWYESEGVPEMTPEDCWRPRPYVGPWKFWKGRITSAPIRIHVHHADSLRVEVRVNSGFKWARRDGRTWWGLSTENPLRVGIMRRPGFYLGRNEDFSIAIGKEEFRRISRGEHSATWEPSGGCSRHLKSEDERRIAAGEPLRIRSEITIFESSNPPGHFWRPESGDYRVLWQGRIEGEMPSTLGAEEPQR